MPTSNWVTQPLNWFPAVQRQHQLLHRHQVVRVAVKPKLSLNRRLLRSINRFWESKNFQKPELDQCSVWQPYFPESRQEFGLRKVNLLKSKKLPGSLQTRNQKVKNFQLSSLQTIVSE